MRSPLPLCWRMVPFPDQLPENSAKGPVAATAGRTRERVTAPARRARLGESRSSVGKGEPPSKIMGYMKKLESTRICAGATSQDALHNVCRYHQKNQKYLASEPITDRLPQPVPRARS